MKKQSKHVILLTREEAKNYLSISLPTLHKWTAEGILISYRLGGRVYYKQHEILKALMATD
jgi:excisionase family DNA binding protein